MRKLALLVLLLCSAAFATTPVTGTLINLGTGTVGTTAFVRFWLRGCGGNQPFVSGTGIIGPSQGGVFYFDFFASSGGAISGTLYSTRDATGLLGGDITCGTSTTSVWYGMQIFNNGKGGPETMLHAKNGVTINIGSPVPISTFPVVKPPTGDDFYFRLDGSNDSILNKSATELDLLGKICWPDVTCQTTAGAQPGTACTSGQFVTQISATAPPTCGTPSGGSGTLTTFSAGNLSPLFTTSVSNPTTTPALSFSLSNAAANTVLAGPTSGGSGVPTYRAQVPLDLTMTTGGDLIYDNAGAIGRLAIGSPGAVLAVNSAGTAPRWGTPFSAVIGPQNSAVSATTLVPSGTAGIYATSFYGSVPTVCASGSAHIDFVILDTDDSGLPISDGTNANADPGHPVISSFALSNFQSSGGTYSPTISFGGSAAFSSNGSQPLQYQIYYVPCNAGAYSCSAGTQDCTSNPGVPQCTSGGSASCAAGQTVACHRIYNATASAANRWSPTCDINAESSHGTYTIRIAAEKK